MKQPIKVLLVSTGSSSGMVPFVASIVNTLSQSKNFEVYTILMVGKTNPYLTSLNSLDNVTFLNHPQDAFNKFLYKFWPLSLIREINAITKNHGAKIVHLLTNDELLSSYVRYTYKKFEYVFTIHDLVNHETDMKRPLKEKLLRSYWKTLRKRMLPCINNYTTSSLEQYNNFKQSNIGKSITYTHFPTLVTNEMVNGNDEVEELKGMYDYILFFGFVDKYKGVNTLIEAFETAKLTDSAHLVIAGKGINYPCKSNNIIRINRFIKNTEIKDLFAKARVVVYPYSSITMSGVQSIASYFNKKTILSDLPYFREHADDNTQFFPANDTKKLTILLENEYKNPLIVVRSNYDSIFSDKTLAEDYYRLYSSINLYRI